MKTEIYVKRIMWALITIVLLCGTAAFLMPTVRVDAAILAQQGQGTNCPPGQEKKDRCTTTTVTETKTVTAPGTTTTLTVTETDTTTATVTEYRYKTVTEYKTFTKTETTTVIVPGP